MSRVRGRISIVRPWTNREDSDLLDFDDNRRPLEEAARHLQRAVADCTARLEQLKARAIATQCACGDTGWVCEEHPGQPMVHDGCGGAGGPCPKCNAASRDSPPTLPPGFRIDYDKDGGSRH